MGRSKSGKSNQKKTRPPEKGPRFSLCERNTSEERSAWTRFSCHLREVTEIIEPIRTCQAGNVFELVARRGWSELFHKSHGRRRIAERVGHH